jgi:hypothetical protein
MDYATCSTATCHAVATHRVFWPGRDPLGMCEACARRAQRISAAMGFHLVIEPALSE